MDSNEGGEEGESLKPAKPAPITPAVMTLDKAIELGEYDPNYLATFPEWHSFTKHIQWEYIKKALENREKQLMQQYAAVNNVLDFSKKPHAHEALKKIEAQYKFLRDEKERLL